VALTRAGARTLTSCLTCQYLRRPPDKNGEWRLDRLLQRKAEEGVKIFVIGAPSRSWRPLTSTVYKEVSDSFTPVDSEYAKKRLLGLHPNIQVQRSPSHAQTMTLLWSHVRLQLMCAA